ncbi:hypothetical protein Aduo_007779 [Ancylostoma duodenale]
MLPIRRNSRRRNGESVDESERLPEINVDERHFPSSLFGHQFAMDTTQDYNFQQLLRNFNSLELYCDAPHESFYASTPNCCIDVPIEEALQFPQKVSNRLPVEIGSMSRHLTLRNLKHSWCRHASHYFEWVSGVPELRMMDMRERIKLVARQTPKIGFLMMSYWTFQKRCGISVKPHENQDELYEIVGDPVTTITTFIHTHIISTFRRINLTRGEYLLLKAVALFEALDQYFPPADRFIVDTALNKYRSALVSCMRRSHPELEDGALLERVQALLGTLTYLEVVRESDNRHMADVVLRNGGGMRGRLAIEIHMHSNRMD